MSNVTMRNIYQSGQLKMEDDNKLIYLTPSEPIVYVSTIGYINKCLR